MMITPYESRMLEINKLLASDDIIELIKNHKLLLDTLVTLNETLPQSKKEAQHWET